VAVKPDPGCYEKDDGPGKDDPPSIKTVHFGLLKIDAAFSHKLTKDKSAKEFSEI